MRFENWPALLIEALDAARGKQFKFGEFDCALFAADIIAAMTGTDLAAKYRGKYSSELGYKKLLGKSRRLEAVIEAAVVDCEEINALLAQRGDLVLYDGTNGVSAGIVYGHNAYFPTDLGLASVSIDQCRRAWRI